MPTITFRELHLKGFGSFLEEAYLRLDQPGLHFIRGINKVQPRLQANDVGKSTLVRAISWCLTGRTLDGLRNPDIQPWNTNNATWVKLDLDVDGKSHEIVRTTKPNQIKLDDELVSQEVLDNFIRINSILNVAILLGQGQPLFFDLEPTKKMQLFTEVLELQKWEDRATFAKDFADRLEGQQSGYNQELTNLEIKLQGIKQSTATCCKRRDEWSAQQLAHLEQYRGECKDQQARLESLENERAKWDLMLDGAATERQALDKEIAEKSRGLLKAQSELERATLTLENDRKRIKSLRQQLQQLKETKRCPTCGQKVTPDKLQEHKAEIIRELRELKVNLAKGVPTAIGETVEAAEATLDRLNRTITEFRIKETEARDKLDQCSPPIAESKAQIKQLQESIEEWESGVNPFAEELQILRKQFTKLQSQQEELKSKANKLGRRIERYRFWQKGFRDIRLLVIEDTLTELELVSNAMLEDMGLVGWEIKYRIEKESKSGNIQQRLDVMILSPNNKEQVRWEVWGGGVGQRLRLIGAFALSEVLLNGAGVQTNLEIVDEPSRHLSEAGRQDLCDTLAERARELNRTIFLIEHTVMESAKFASTVTVTKDKSGSHISV